MKLDEAILESNKLIQWLSARIDGVEVSSAERVRMAVGCLDMVLEHQRAIVLLTSSHIYGSAAALICLVFESYVRGLWLYFAASDDELDDFKRDNLRKNFAQLIEDVEKHDAYHEGVLSSVKELSWKVMNSFKHTGFYQVVRRNKESEISPNYSDEEIIDGLESANAFAILTGIAIADIAKDEHLAYDVYERGMEYFKKNPNRALQPTAESGG